MGAQQTEGGNAVASAEEGGWPENVVGPSTIPFSDTYPKPRALTVEEIDSLEDKYVEAVQRCKKIGCKLAMFTLLKSFFCLRPCTS